MTNQPHIPQAFHEAAARYGLIIKQIYGMRQYVVRDEAINAALVVYKEWELMTLTAETLTTDIEQAIDNYVAPEPFDPIEHERLHERPRHLATGHFQ